METTHIGFPPLTMAVFVGLALAALLLDMVTHRDDKPITLARLYLVRVLGGDFPGVRRFPLRATRR